MKTLVLAAFAAVSLSGAAVAGPGHDHSHPHGSGSHDAAEKASLEARTAPMREVSVTELSELMGDEKVVVFDANGEETRRKFGTIPGATLLASAASYDLAVLPESKDKLLVFYCANPRCTAAETAAKRAVGKGYQVAVLKVGIAGWADAGKETTSFSKS